jgi:hypothetical protein
MVREKAELYSRKVKWWAQNENHERLIEVTREVNKIRQMLRKTYFRKSLESHLGRCWVGVGKRGVAQNEVFFRRKRRG